MAEKQNTLYVGALAKGLKLLRAFDGTHTSLSLSELTAMSGLDKSATQRLANTLHLEGMLDKDEQTRRYSPSHAWLKMAFAYSLSDPLIGNALPRLIDFSRQVGQTVNLLEQSGEQIIYVYRLPCKRSSFASSVVGRCVQALTSSGGRAMLATHPPEARRRALKSWSLHPYTAHTTMDRQLIADKIQKAGEEGFSISRDEVLLNEVAVSAPIVSADGIARSAVQCSVSGQTWSEERVRGEIVPYLLDTANAISPVN